MTIEWNGMEWNGMEWNDSLRIGSDCLRSDHLVAR